MDLLERDDCLERLEVLLADAVGGQGRVALVSGEAGIGKTTLMRRFAEHPGGRMRVLWGNCDAQFTPRPLGPVWDMVTHLHGGVSRMLSDGTDRGSMFSAILAELCCQSTLAVFEDLHWADDATLDLLGFLARRVSGSPVLLVCTYRDDELGLRHPLRLLLGDLVTSQITSRLVLSPLTRAAVRTLVGERAVDAGELHRRTAGNPISASVAGSMRGPSTAAACSNSCAGWDRRATRASTASRTVGGIAMPSFARTSVTKNVSPCRVIAWPKIRGRTVKSGGA
jgi:predicted ATPase